jgi:hypothetical protein
MSAASADRLKVRGGVPARISGGSASLPRDDGAPQRTERQRDSLISGERFLVMLGVRLGRLVGVPFGA